MDKDQIRVMLADDTLIARAGWKMIIGTSKNIVVVAEAENIAEVNKKVRESKPHVLLMDLKWLGDRTAGWAKIKEIKNAFPDVRIIAITAYEELIPDARMAGADAILTKTFSREELLNQISEVVISKPNVPLGPPRHAQQEELTPREMEVLHLLDKGSTDKEIAAVLNIAQSTAKNHVKNIIAKLNAKNRLHAVSEARKLGYLS